MEKPAGTRKEKGRIETRSRYYAGSLASPPRVLRKSSFSSLPAGDKSNAAWFCFAKRETTLTLAGLAPGRPLAGPAPFPHFPLIDFYEPPLAIGLGGGELTPARASSLTETSSACAADAICARFLCTCWSPALPSLADMRFGSRSADLERPRDFVDFLGTT